MHNLRNIGILAHVDAGKTTITESMLYLSGAIRNRGSVDKGTSKTDSLEIEKQRGISVRSALTSVQWKDVKINIIDAPGHADFIAEVDRALMAMDAVVLVINAVDAVQGQTKVLWNTLKKKKLPVIFFINKIDRAGADEQEVIKQIKKELTNDIIVLQELEGIGTAKVNIHPLSSIRKMNVEYNEEKIEKLAEYNDVLFERYLNEDLPSTEELHELLSTLTSEAKIHPVLFGSAKFDLGVKELLDAIRELFPKPLIKNTLSALIYQIRYDDKLGRLAGIRLFGGKIEVKDTVRINDREEYKVNQIQVSDNGNEHFVNKLEAGETAMLSGLTDVMIGDFIGTNPGIDLSTKIAHPLLSSKVHIEDQSKIGELAAALKELTDEDPELEFHWFREENELQVKIIGWMQLEILKHQMKERYNLDVTFENPTIIYKETPADNGFGNERYTMPKPCWAVVKLKIEKGERESGLICSSEVSVDKIHQKYQNEVLRTIPEAIKQGIKGWEVTDLKVTLIDGEDHEIHSRPGDFILATHIAFMNGLEKIGTILLEPIVAFKINAPEEMLGKIVSDITQMRGTFESPEIIGDRFEMEGELPLASSMEYPVKLTSRSGGKARIDIQFKKYSPCSDTDGVLKAYKGINPLDRSKYILHHRGAIQ